jgi:Bax protein
MNCFQDWGMMRRDMCLLVILFTFLSAFIPDMVPGMVADRADEVGCSLVEYAGAATIPQGFPRIQDPEQRKQVLIGLLLPLVLKANEDIIAQRQQLQRIKKHPASMRSGDRQLVEDLARTYHVVKGSHRAMLEELLVRVDVLPASLVLAQAAIESGWGTSRFALQGNNVFGLRGPGGLGMVPVDRSPGCGFSVSIFGDLQECINCYMWTINTNTEYERLRKLRTQERTHYDPILLAQGLEGYSEMGNAYVHKVMGVIRENNLMEYDSYRLRPMRDQRMAQIPARFFKPADFS